MTTITRLAPRDFDNASRVKWFRPNSINDDLADFNADAYEDEDQLTKITVIRTLPQQRITVSTCSTTVGVRCNLQPKTSLLLAQNSLIAPIFLRFSGNGLSKVGAFVVAQVMGQPFGKPYVPHMWVERDSSGLFEHISGDQGVTGDVWDPNIANATVAPFMGAAVNGGSRITAIKFEAIHPTDFEYTPIGIGYLYCVR
jgi:hypothetical protein